MTLYIGGFSRVVAFPTAPIATGRSDPCRKGLAPSQEPCLSTAHTYDSLSKVAFAITGTKWNGPRFFGLRDKEDRLDAGARS
jgi:hypothetical protein